MDHIFNRLQGLPSVHVFFSLDFLKKHGQRVSDVDVESATHGVYSGKRLNTVSARSEERV
jgi:ribosomal protein L31